MAVDIRSSDAVQFIAHRIQIAIPLFYAHNSAARHAPACYPIAYHDDGRACILHQATHCGVTLRGAREIALDLGAAFDEIAGVHS